MQPNLTQPNLQSYKVGKLRAVQAKVQAEIKAEVCAEVELKLRLKFGLRSDPM